MGEGHLEGAAFDGEAPEPKVEGGEAGSVEGPGAHHLAAGEIGIAADLFMSTLEGLQDLVALAAPHLEPDEEARSYLSEDALAAVGRMTPEKKEELIGLLRSWGRRHGGDQEGEPEPEPEPSYGDQFAKVFGDDMRGFMAFTRSWFLLGTRPARRDLLNSSALISAVGALEVLVGALVASYFRLFPDALEPDQLKFSLEEVLAFTSIEQAQSAAVDRRVDSVMFDGFAGWRKWLEGRLSISLTEVMIDEAEFVEVLQRRHCIVHTGGVASRQYVDAMAKVGVAESVGTPLVVDADYFEEALDQLRMFGLGLVGKAFKRWFPPEANSYAYAILESYVLTLLSGQRYELVACLTKAQRDLPRAASAKAVLRVNNWIARKRLNGFKDIEEELAAWDVSALSPQYVLAKLVLSNEHDGAIALAAQLVEEGRLNIADLHRWPLFDELRDDPRFLELAKQVGGATGYAELDSQGEDVLSLLEGDGDVDGDERDSDVSAGE